MKDLNIYSKTSIITMLLIMTISYLVTAKFIFNF